MSSAAAAASRKRARLPSVQDEGDGFIHGGANYAAASAASAAAFASASPDQGIPPSFASFSAANPFVAAAHSLDSRTSTPSSVTSGHSPPNISPIRDAAYQDFSNEGYPSYHSSPTSSSYGAPSNLPARNPTSHPAAPASRVGQASASFRNVSACNRCRVRKNKCDQKLPACSACEKAGVKCVGFDPFLNRPVPRSYVYHLETRIAYLEGLLNQNSVPYATADEFAFDKNADSDSGGREDGSGALQVNTQPDFEMQIPSIKQEPDPGGKGVDRNGNIDRLVSNIGQVSVQGTSDPRYLGSTSGISFARVVFAALKKSASRASSERGGGRPGSGVSGAAAGGISSMRDSVFGLHSKPSIKEAPFPRKELGLKLVNVYFEHANPQIPTLHRTEFMSMFERVYRPGHERTPRETYLLNIVFAIGAGTILNPPEKQDAPKEESGKSPKDSRNPKKKARLSDHQCEPEEYHAAAIVHLESFLHSSPVSEHPEGFGGGLEELQAVLLLAGFALLRPVSPGLWYIVGVAMRLAIDMGLHYEDGADVTGGQQAASLVRGEDVYFRGAGDDSTANPGAPGVHSKEIARREWVRDLRRRLWWCVYSLDRLVGTVVGRPFSISDQFVTTEFPSILDDKFITPTGFLPTPSPGEPTYKHVSRHYFRLRLLQSEICQVLQYKSAQRAYQCRLEREKELNPYTISNLRSPFLDRFGSYLEWRTDVDRRLWEWKESAPRKESTGVQFNSQFLELNYWQAVILLYRQSVITPSVVAAEEQRVKDGLTSPHEIELDEDGDIDFVHLKIAEAGQKVVKIYLQLHRMHVVSYTYLATHHLFMAGISFLYAIWHSVTVRSKLTFDDVEFTVFAAKSVLSDLVERCEPAETCKEAFERMSRIIIQLCLSTTGFGPQALAPRRKSKSTRRHKAHQQPGDIPRSSNLPPRSTPAKPQQESNMDLGELLATRDMQQQLLQQDGFPMDSAAQQFHGMPGSFPQNAAPLSPASSDFQDSPWDAMQFPGAYNPTLSDFGDLPDHDMSFMMEEFAPPAAAAAAAGPVAAAPFAGPVDEPSNLHLLGIGGLDGSHDWNDGVGGSVDVFNGYFFGGGTAGGI